MQTIKCLYCGLEVEALRPSRKKFCSYRCSQRYAHHLPSIRNCKICDKEFPINKGDQNRRYCSQACAKKANTKNTLAWHQTHPGVMSTYNAKRVLKHPGIWREKYRSGRIETIRLLGGKCIVCGVNNPHWLHLDYIPTTNGKPYRHPRHLKFIKEHISDFRLLCANHHYELTLTGMIVGTMITQSVHHS